MVGSGCTMGAACGCDPNERNTSGRSTSCTLGHTHGRPLRLLVIVDEHTRECLSIDAARKLTSDDVLERLAWLMATPVLNLGRAGSHPE
jgi:hypothetical protein